MFDALMTSLGHDNGLSYPLKPSRRYRHLQVRCRPRRLNTFVTSSPSRRLRSNAWSIQHSCYRARTSRGKLSSR
eukprot:scaffold504709_cov19-Prasinocladus_malaysianus.AAC.2